MPTTRAEILAWRQQHFKVSVEPDDTPEAPDELLLQITHNGYQWTTLALSPEEAKQVVRALNLYLDQLDPA